MASRVSPVLAAVYRIDAPKGDVPYKAVVQLKLNGGTITLQPRTLLADSGDMVGADAQLIEWWQPGVSASVSTADITASGIYEFLLEGKSLLLTVSAMTGAPILAWNTVEAETGPLGGTASGGLTDAQLRATPVPVSNATDAAVQGTTADAAVITDVNGTHSSKLRGTIVLLLQLIAKIPAALSQNAGNVDAGTLRVITAADGPLNTNLGATTDAAVITDVNGTVSAKLRGLIVLTLQLLARLPAALGAGGGIKVDGSGTALPVTIAANSAVNVAQINGVVPLMGAGNTGTGSPRVTVATDQAPLPVTAPTLTKGTQGAQGFTTQDFKDAGRANISIGIDRFNSAATAETIVNTMSYSNAYGARTTGQTSYPVTAAKTLRIALLTMLETVVSGNTTATGLIIRMRVNPSGAATISSAVAHMWYLAGSAGAAAGSGFAVVTNSIFTIEDGQEFPAGAGLCFTVEDPGYVVTTAAPSFSADVTGMEY